MRSVNRPLRALTASARDLSEHRLPALVDSLHKGADVIATQLDSLTPIEVQSEDELGELANAFNSVQQTTANVARQQVELLRKGIGDLYVSLARRTEPRRSISILSTRGEWTGNTRSTPSP